MLLYHVIRVSKRFILIFVIALSIHAPAFADDKLEDDAGPVVTGPAINNYDKIDIIQSGSLYPSVVKAIEDISSKLNLNTAYFGRATLGMVSITHSDGLINTLTKEGYSIPISVFTVDNDVANYFYGQEITYILKSNMAVVSEMTALRHSLVVGDSITFLTEPKGSNSLPLTIFNKNWPKQWKIILVFDKKISGIFGKSEVQEFNKVKKEVLNIGNINCKTVLMKILPSIIEKDFANFSSGIQIIQDNMSKIFYRNKKNKFASKKIELIFNFLKKKKISGFGQTSWGPTGFIFCENINEQNRLEKTIKNFLKQEKISNISLTKIDGRNKGSIKINR